MRSDEKNEPHSTTPKRVLGIVELSAIAAMITHHAVHYVDDTGDCVFCAYQGRDEHEEFCPLAEAP